MEVVVAVKGLRVLSAVSVMSMVACGMVASTVPASGRVDSNVGTGVVVSATSPTPIQVAPGTSARLVEWRRVDQTPLSLLEVTLAQWAERGGTAMVLDVSFLVDAADAGVPRAQSFAAIREYVKLAKRYGFTAHATAGDPRWIADTTQAAVIAAGLADYNQSFPRQRLASMTWNVEPWGSPQWQDDPTAGALRFLSWTKDVMALPTGSRNGVFVPYWFDGRVPGLSSVSWLGRDATIAQHVASIVATTRGSFIDVMAYQDTHARTLAAISPWLRLRVPVRAAITVSPSDPGSTWNGAPWSTVAGVLNLVESEFGRHKWFRGVDLDCSTYLPVE